ncbi:MAG: hypothetical protein WKF61_00610 [Luteimonas sp.]
MNTLIDGDELSRTLFAIRPASKLNGKDLIFRDSMIDLVQRRLSEAALTPQAARPDDDAMWDKTLRDRDAYHDASDELAAMIAEITDADIGEHSSSNQPWGAAKFAAEEYIERRTTQAGGDAVDFDKWYGSVDARFWNNYDACKAAWVAARPTPAPTVPSERMDALFTDLHARSEEIAEYLQSQPAPSFDGGIEVGATQPEVASVVDTERAGVPNRDALLALVEEINVDRSIKSISGQHPALWIQRAEQALAQPDVQSEVNFELWQDEMIVAVTSGPYEAAQQEIEHYAMIYGQDGPVRIVEVTRTTKEPK